MFMDMSDQNDKGRQATLGEVEAIVQSTVDTAIEDLAALVQRELSEMERCIRDGFR